MRTWALRDRKPHGKRPRADLNRDRWIQGPNCYPLHHEAGCNRVIDFYVLAKRAQWGSELCFPLGSCAFARHELELYSLV